MRPLFGYGRIDECELVDVVNETATLRSLFDNLFTPTMRLISKQRIGAKYIKVFEKQPKTPAQRILEDPTVAEHHKIKLRTLLANTDLIALKTAVQTAMNTFRRLEALLANTPRRTRK